MFKVKKISIIYENKLYAELHNIHIIYIHYKYLFIL